MLIIMQFDQIILVAALFCVAGILFWGVITMARGGAYNVKNSNRIMRYRIKFLPKQASFRYLFLRNW